MHIGVDLGSTNLKAALFDENLVCVAQESAPVNYIRSAEFVEFDASAYYDALVILLKQLGQKASGVIKQISFTEIGRAHV